MSEYHSFSLSQHLTNKTSNDNNNDENNRIQDKMYQPHKFTLTEELNLHNNNIKNQQQQQQHDWSQTSLDSILNNAPNFRNQNNTTNQQSFNPLFDFLPAFDDHLIIVQPTNNNNAADNSITHFNTNHNVIHNNIYIRYSD